MDYDELKLKYGATREEKTGWAQLKSLKLAFVAILTIAAVALFVYFYFFHSPPVSGKNEEILAELASVEVFENAMDLVKKENCQQLSKYENVDEGESGAEWIVSGCDDDVDIHFVFLPNGRYNMRICGGWTDGQDVAIRSSNVLANLNMLEDCDASGIDLESVSFLRTEAGTDAKAETDVYNICGREIYLRGVCIV